MLDDLDLEFLEKMKDTDMLWVKTLLERMNVRIGLTPEASPNIMSVAEYAPIAAAVFQSYIFGFDKLMDDMYQIALPAEKATLEAVLPANAMAFRHASLDFSTHRNLSKEDNCALINGFAEWARIVDKAIAKTKEINNG